MFGNDPDIMWTHALRTLMRWTRERAMDESDTKPPGAADAGAKTERCEPRSPTRLPTPDDFILDWSETDPFRRFRISPRPKIPRDTASPTSRFRPTE
jgi:hypothetical protein